MAQKSNIEWTDASWNPTRGCTKVSSGCRNCYAIRQAHRMDVPGGHYEGLTEVDSTGHLNWTGQVALVESALDLPPHWKKPKRIFVDSMSDLFHEQVPFEFIDKVFATIIACPWHTFQILTKRPERMVEYFKDTGYRAETIGIEAEDVTGLDRFVWNEQGDGGDHRWPLPLPNVWLGVSCENQTTADERIPLLLSCPAAVHWVSAEPLLGPLIFRYDFLPRMESLGHTLDWVVVGAESGKDARRMDIEWAREIRDQCQAAGVAFYMKQLCVNGKKIPYEEFPVDLKIREFPI